jgi:hypothetical protein
LELITLFESLALKVVAAVAEIQFEPARHVGREPRTQTDLLPARDAHGVRPERLRGLPSRGRIRHNASMTTILHRIGWIGLTLIAAFLLFAVANDLRADRSTGIPVNHVGAFQALASTS